MPCNQALPIVSQALWVPECWEAAPVAVYGVGHAGAGAAPWKTVAAQLAPRAEIRAYRLPARETRIREPAHVTIEAAAAELAAVILNRLGDDSRPYLIAGICSGALIGRVALGVIKHATPEAAQAALGLVVIDQKAPVTPVPPLSALSGADLRRWLRRHQGTPPEVLGDNRLFSFYEPILRADLRMAETYRHCPQPLTAPLLLVRATGQTDRDIDLANWRADAAGPVYVLDTPVPGGLLGTHPAELADVLHRALGAPTVPCSRGRVPR